MNENMIPMVVMTGMFAMIFGIVYIRSRENMALIEKGLNPRIKDVRPQPFINLKWGLLLIGCGLGLLTAYTLDHTLLKHEGSAPVTSGITIGGHHNSKKTNAVAVADTSHAAKDTVAASGIAVSVSDDNDDVNEENHSIVEIKGRDNDNPAIYFALIAIGGGLGLFFSYRIEKKEWLDKRPVA